LTHHSDATSAPVSIQPRLSLPQTTKPYNAHESCQTGIRRCPPGLGTHATEDRLNYQAQADHKAKLTNDTGRAGWRVGRVPPNDTPARSGACRYRATGPIGDRDHASHRTPHRAPSRTEQLAEEARQWPRADQRQPKSRAAPPQADARRNSANRRGHDRSGTSRRTARDSSRSRRRQIPPATAQRADSPKLRAP
jgi:hypothetical protein